MPASKTTTTRPETARPQANTGLAITMMPWSLGARVTLTWLEGVTRMQGEWTRFMAERLAKDAEIQHAIVACRSPTQAQELGTHFMHGVISDYLTETTRMTAMGAHVTDEAGLNV